MVQKENIFPIGIGTWNIDCKNIEKEIPSLVYSFSQGQNYLSLYMLYNHGEVVKNVKKFIDEVGRENLFITVNLEPSIVDISDVETQLNEYLQVLDLRYVDSLQLHSPVFSKIPLVEVYLEIQRLVSVGKVRYIGISNVNLEQLIEVHEAVSVDFFEGVYNLECKIYEDIGVLEYCKCHNIQFVCYQPLRRGRTANRYYSLLLELSKKYQKTQNQIILNWIWKEKHLFPLVKSTNIDRISENIYSLNFDMSREDYEKMNQFRSNEFDSVVIDWNGAGGVSIDQLANQFE